MEASFDNLKNLTLEELSRVVQAYPWFGLARKMLCVKLLESGNCDLAQEQISEAGMYVCSRGKLRTDLEEVKPDVAEAKTKSVVIPQQKKIVVVGGDFFSQDEYDSVEHDEPIKVPSFRPVEKSVAAAEKPKKEDGSALDAFCTEPMAEILLDQGYLSEAKYIYSKLVLRYPEKSAYFAALIAKIDQEIKN